MEFQPWHVGLAVFFMIACFISWWEVEKRHNSSRLAAYIRGELPRDKPLDIKRGFINAVLKLTRPLLPKPQVLERWELIIYRAGMEIKPEELYALRWTSGVVMGALTSLLFTPNYTWMLAAGIFNGLMFYLLPASYVKGRAKMRQARAQDEVLKYVGMLEKVCRAGLDIKAGVRRVADRMPGVLSAEFDTAFDQRRRMRFSEAIESLKKRIGVKDVDLLVDALQQAERGANIVTILQDQAQRIRRSTWERHAQAAQKAPLKMLAPLFLFIFPPLFVLMLGPVAMNLKTVFTI